MFEPCPTCGGSGERADVYDEEGNFDVVKCPSCVGGRVVSESVIEEIAEAIGEKYGNELRGDFDIWRVDPRAIARAAARVVLEHMEDNERKPG